MNAEIVSYSLLLLLLLPATTTQTLSAQYPDLYPKDPALTSRIRDGRRCNPRSALAGPFVTTPPLLTQDAEQSLLKSMSTIIRPPRKPLNLKIFMRRAPTQEEFFRGNLTKNPVGLGTLRGSSSSSTTNAGGGGGEERRSSAGGGGNGDGNEPRVRDLRIHIAKDLQVRVFFSSFVHFLVRFSSLS